MQNKIKVVVKDERYLPSYANNTDACMDLKIKLDDCTCDYVMPNQTKTFGTGLQVAIPEDFVMLVFPRSSTGFKLNCMLANTTGVIDAGYRDEIKIALHNYGKEEVALVDGQRIAQFMIIPRPRLELECVQDDETFRYGDRGGGIGSTGV